MTVDMIKMLEMLPRLLPQTVSWAELQSEYILKNGTPLSEEQMAIAREVGVAHPEQIRLMDLSAIQQPSDPMLREIINQLGLLGEGIGGITLAYGVLLNSQYLNNTRVLSHEFRHVYQYEQAGSISNYMKAYFEQVMQYGYKYAPLEVDAQKHEIKE
jgi:hypothetical protein